MSSKYILAKSKNQEILEGGACGGAVSSIFQYLLENELVDGVLTLRAEEDIYDGIPTLITDSSEIPETCGSLHCAPTMIGDLISKFLKDKKIAVAVKPCDVRAIDELIKRNKINPDNLITVGLNCGGSVLPITARKMIELFYEVDPDDVVKEEIDKGKFIIELKDGTEKGIKIDDLEDDGYGRRENCQRCFIKIPRNADIACGNWGAEEGWTFIEINNDKGDSLVNNAKSNGFIETKNPSEKLIEIRSKIENIMIKMGKKNQATDFDNSAEKMMNDWNRCINCYACRDICPICWCYNNCEMEKSFFNKDSVPAKPILTQGIRLSHMGLSCCDCGQCDDVCPMDIPVSKVFDKLQKKYRDRTGYISGISEEKPPLYSPEKEEL